MTENEENNSKKKQITSTIIEYINIPAWPTEDKQKLKKRLLFYIPFYIFIAGLFYAWVAIFHAVEKANSDGIRPYLHGRGIQSPGINYVPRLKNSVTEHLAYIKEKHKDIDDNVAFAYKSGKGDIYVNAMKKFLEEERYDISEYGDFEECSNDDFGFNADKPCIFLKINKVVDWAPLGIQADDIDAFFATTESNLMSSQSYCSEDRFGEWCTGKIDDRKQAIKEAIFRDASDGTPGDYSKPFVYCMNIKGVEVPITTYPSNGQLNFDTPFTGYNPVETRKGRSIFAGRDTDESASHAKYKTAMVAVQFDFTDDQYKNKDIHIHCFMFDRNMEIETKDKASGMIELFIRVDK